MRPSQLINNTILLSSTFGLCLGVTAQTGQSSFGQAGMEGLSGAPVVNILPPIQIGCPVSLRAQHRANASLLQADKSRPKGLAQRLHLTLVDPQSRQIVAARVRVHGLSGKTRVTQTITDSTPADSTETLDVRFSSVQGKAAEADLWVPAMTAVLTIELNSVTYADGSRRSFSAQDNCRVTPDPLMLVASH